MCNCNYNIHCCEFARFISCINGMSPPVSSEILCYSRIAVPHANTYGIRSTYELLSCTVSVGVWDSHVGAVDPGSAAVR